VTKRGSSSNHSTIKKIQKSTITTRIKIKITKSIQISNPSPDLRANSSLIDPSIPSWKNDADKIQATSLLKGIRLSENNNVKSPKSAVLISKI